MPTLVVSSWGVVISLAVSTPLLIYMAPIMKTVLNSTESTAPVIQRPFLPGFQISTVTSAMTSARLTSTTAIYFPGSSMADTRITANAMAEMAHSSSAANPIPCISRQWLPLEFCLLIG